MQYFPKSNHDEENSRIAKYFLTIDVIFSRQNSALTPLERHEERSQTLFSHRLIQFFCSLINQNKLKLHNTNMNYVICRAVDQYAHYICSNIEFFFL